LELNLTEECDWLYKFVSSHRAVSSGLLQVRLKILPICPQTKKEEEILMVDDCV
jgi:hypothetical protein